MKIPVENKHGLIIHNYIFKLLFPGGTQGSAGKRSYIEWKKQQKQK